MKIIFLDVDGVLNSQYSFKRHGNILYDEYLKNLKKIVLETKANIVISSTWRKSDILMNELKEYLEKYEISQYLIGKTDNYIGINKERGDEIRKWINDNKHLNIETFVIIDDDIDMREFTNTNLAKCKNETGFTDEVLHDALEILKNGIKTNNYKTCRIYFKGKDEFCITDCDIKNCKKNKVNK